MNVRSMNKDEMEKEYEKAGSIGKLADKFGVNPRVVWEKMRELGVERKGWPIKPPPKKELHEVYKEVSGVAEVADFYDVSVPTVNKWMDDYGLKRTRKVDIDVDEMYEMHLDGLSFAKLADYYGVSRNTIQRRFDEHDLEAVEFRPTYNFTKMELQDYKIRGYELKDIAEEEGCSVSTVRYWMDHHGL